jgi:2,4-dienoyl-CoA reductase-like NADH-dependent reductase (Old Yellow Enzyme family)
MCQYAATNGVPDDYHLVHYGSRSSGGPGLLIVEATGVSLRGRISYGCTTIHTDEHTKAWKRITEFAKRNGTPIGIQIAHAGRKASCHRPWEGDNSITDDTAWLTEAPSALAFGPGIEHTPHALTVDEIKEIVTQFSDAARRAVEAGFDLIEIHNAHGYLLHEFLSPLSNKRTDEYGGSFENRVRLSLEVVEAVRKIIPEEMPLFVRISASDYHAEGWTVDDSVELSKLYKSHGVDLIDVSSGFVIPNYRDIPFGPNYHVPMSERIRKEAGIATGVVGFITKAKQSDDIIRNESADLVIIAREFLRDPYFPYHAAVELGIQDPELTVLPINYSHWLKGKRH